MDPINAMHSTLNLLSNRLHFSISTTNLYISGVIVHGSWDSQFIRRVTNPSSKRQAVSSNAIVTEDFHLTLFTLTRLHLDTVLLPFDEGSWSCLSFIIVEILTLIIAYNRHNYNSSQVVILWMLRNIFEQDDAPTTKQACGSKTITKYGIILWSLCSKFIGWSYKCCVSSEVSVKFPSSIPNSLQQILDMNMSIITTTVLKKSPNVSHLHEDISDLLNQQQNVDYSSQYLQFLSFLSRQVQYVDLVLDHLGCDSTQNILRLVNSSNVLIGSWSLFSFKGRTNSLTALMDTCTNFTSIKIPSYSNQFPERFVWIGYGNIFLKIFSNKLAQMTQAGIYYCWNKDCTRKTQIVVWKSFIRSMNNSPADVLIEAKHVLRKQIAEIDRYQTLFKLNPITLTNVHMPLVAFGALNLLLLCNVFYN